jgi:threonine/homoserine/homoserine lactone efflux protein
MNCLPPSNDLLLFITAALILLVIPGPAVLYIVARSVDQGRKAGVTSAVAYSFVKYAGAAYLLYLGVKKFRERPAADDEVKQAQALPLRRVYAQAVLVQVLNPKAAIFFFALLPQFVNPVRGHVSLQFFALGMLFTVMGFTSDSVWASTAGSAAGWLRRSQIFIRNQHYVSGTVYLGLGVATAVSGSRHK